MHVLPWRPERTHYTLKLSSLITVSHSEHVQVILHASLRGSHCAQVGFVVTELFGGFHLLTRVMSLTEVTQVGSISV